LHGIEKETVFEGCMPVEVMARRGEQTLLFGPLKPVGLTDPKTGRQPYAVVQLRQDNKEGTLFNLVGFQTNLKWPEQKRVFSIIPALREAEFVRYGVMHRNTFINSPKLLGPDLQMVSRPGVFFAGQITGVEGYVESAAAGIAAGVNMSRLLKNMEPVVFPRETVMGSLCSYITTFNAGFQPMNANFGLLPPLESRVRNKKQRNQLFSERSLEIMQSFIKEHSIVPHVAL
jgi:methylenetetrahydrofolate--tRNA-(uracil-5-)-methyltransferase